MKYQVIQFFKELVSTVCFFRSRVVLQACLQRAAYWRWAGFLALTLIRRTKVEFRTSVDTKPFAPPIANTMLLKVLNRMSPFALKNIIINKL